MKIEDICQRFIRLFYTQKNSKLYKFYQHDRCLLNNKKHTKFNLSCLFERIYKNSIILFICSTMAFGRLFLVGQLLS